MIDFVVDLVEEHVGSGGSRFSESILERWHSALDFTVECGIPGILKSMSPSILSRSVCVLGLMMYFWVILHCNGVFIRLP